jgi:hypothetical protein
MKFSPLSPPFRKGGLGGFESSKWQCFLFNEIAALLHWGGDQLLWLPY